MMMVKTAGNHAGDRDGGDRQGDRDSRVGAGSNGDEYYYLGGLLFVNIA